MKKYPSIPRSFETIPDAHTFAKLDGNHIRVQWVRKKGWVKFGSKEVLMDEQTPVLGPAKPLFLSTLAEPLAKVLHDARYKQALVFCEYWGAKSFIGQHEADDPKFITLFDVDPDEMGILSPKDFLKGFGKHNLEIAHYIGQFNWTRGFLEQVWRNEIPGITFEGVVGKAGRTGAVKMAKAKTKQWIDKLHQRLTDQEIASRFSPEETQTL